MICKGQQGLDQDGLYRRRKHTTMVECSQERKQNPRIHNTLTKTGWNHVDKVFPRCIIELDEHHHQVTNAHEHGPSPHQVRQLAPAGHDNAGDEPTNRCSQGGNGQSRSSLRGGFQQDNLKKKRQSE